MQPIAVTSLNIGLKWDFRILTIHTGVKENICKSQLQITGTFIFSFMVIFLLTNLVPSFHPHIFYKQLVLSAPEPTLYSARQSNTLSKLQKLSKLAIKAGVTEQKYLNKVMVCGAGTFFSISTKPLRNGSKMTVRSSNFVMVLLPSAIYKTNNMDRKCRYTKCVSALTTTATQQQPFLGII